MGNLLTFLEETETKTETSSKAVQTEQMSLFDFFNCFTAEEKAELKASPVGKKAGKTKKCEGQVSLFDLIAC